MNTNSIGPSFKGYIKLKENIPYYGDVSFEEEHIFNTNSIAIKSYKQNSHKTGETSILFQDKKYPCNVDWETLQKAILKADANPGKIIDVETCKPKSFDVEI